MFSYFTCRFGREEVLEMIVVLSFLFRIPWLRLPGDPGVPDLPEVADLPGVPDLPEVSVARV